MKRIKRDGEEKNGIKYDDYVDDGEQSNSITICEHAHYFSTSTSNRMYWFALVQVKPNTQTHAEFT